MNIIDALVVTLGLDKSNFDKNQKEAQKSLKETGIVAEKVRKDQEEQAKKTAEAYGKVRDSIMGITAAVVTAVAGGEFLSFLTKNDTAAANLAVNVGTVTKEVSILEGVFRRMGSSTADADAFLRTTNKILEDIKLTGTSGALLPFVQGGLNVAAFRDAKSMEDRIQMLAGAAKHLSPQDAQYRLQAAGYSESTINIMLQRRHALSDLIAEQEKLNVVNEHDAELAFERQKAWGDFTESLTGLGRQIANFITPVIVGLTNAMTAMVSWMTNNVPVAIGLLGGLVSVLMLLKGYSITTMASAFTGNLATMTAALGTFMGKLGLVGLAGAGGWLVGTGLNNMFGLDDKISGLFSKDTFNPYEGTAAHPGITGYTPAAKGGNLFSGLESKYGLPAGLLDQMWRQESGRGTNMLSSKGAKGHFQFMDATAAQYGLTNPNDLNSSAEAAAHYMSDLMRANGGDLSRALAAYNEGQGNLNAGRMPAETMGYVSSIMGGMQSVRRGSSPNVTVGNVTIQTTSSTMTGTGADLGKGLNNYLVAQQANNGVN